MRKKKLMRSKYLHELKDFPDLIKILASETGVVAGLIKKDYWIMHVLYGLTKQNFSFEMKGGILLAMRIRN